jgi:hypothetical protein
MKFSSLGCKFKLKSELLRNIELQSFELTRIYCIRMIKSRMMGWAGHLKFI